MGGKHGSYRACDRQDKVLQDQRDDGTQFWMTHGPAMLECLSASEKVPSFPPDSGFYQMELSVLSWRFSQV